MYFLVVPKLSENVLVMKAKGLWLSMMASTTVLADSWWMTITTSMMSKAYFLAMLLQLNLLLRIFMVLAEMILMSLSKTLNLIMMSMRMNGCFFRIWEPILLAFQPTSIPVNCLRNSEIFGKFLIFLIFPMAVKIAYFAITGYLLQTLLLTKKLKTSIIWVA